MFKRQKAQVVKQELANAIDEKNKKTTRKLLKGKTKIRARIERHGDFGIGPQYIQKFSILNKTGHYFLLAKFIQLAWLQVLKGN